MNIFRAIFIFLYELVIGCSHEHVTRPFTLQQQTYKVCLDCGKQIFYSPVTMRPLTGRELRRMQAAQAGEVRVMTPGIATANGPTLVRAEARKTNAA
jgi:hypothetical protein